MDYIKTIALVASIVLPLWNIPLIYRIIQRKSSSDISLSWALGVWVCLVLMAPAGFASQDHVFRTYNIINIILFTLVTVVVLLYRGKRSR